MIDQTIPYKSIYMRCDSVKYNAFIEKVDGFSIKHFELGDEIQWREIQLSVGEFKGYTVDQVDEYFYEKFLKYPNETAKRCVFAIDNKTGRYVGTCFAWFKRMNGQRIPVLHWLAVRDEVTGRGLARMLISEVMRIFNEWNPSQKTIYLHTQPCSYQAIKLYYDFGFRIIKTEAFGNSPNEWKEALEILEKHMERRAFEKVSNMLCD